MADIIDKKSGLPKLQQPKPPPEKDPMTIEPLNEKVIFKQKEKPVEPTVNDPNIVVEDTPAPAPAPVKKKKKRVLSQKHREALERGRLKGLEKRRQAKLERERKARELAGIKEETRVNKMAAKHKREQDATLRLAKKYKEEAERKAMSRNTVENNVESAPAPAQTSNKDSEFEKFFSMMSRYEEHKANQRRAKVAQEEDRKRAEAEKRRQERQANLERYGRPSGLRHKRKARPRIQKQSTTSNPYLQYFS